MDQSKFPTKANLIHTKNTLTLARQGYNLLDQKLNALNHEITALREEVKIKENQLESLLEPAAFALIKANMDMGPSKVKSVSYDAPLDDSIQVKFRNIMGVKVPVITSKSSANAPSANTPVYDLSTTTTSLDEAYQKFSELKNQIINLAESAITLKLLEENIRKTSKRANALQYIVIPDNETQLKFIQSTLEERERDGFARLKVGKQLVSVTNQLT